MKKATEIMMIIISFADTWCEQGKKAKKKKKKNHFYAMETFMFMCNYFTTFMLYKLLFFRT